MGKGQHRDPGRDEDILFNPEIFRCLIINFLFSYFEQAFCCDDIPGHFSQELSLSKIES